MDRDKFLSASEAKEFGIVDEVFDKRRRRRRGCGQKRGLTFRPL
jgi:hypothetical protein